MKALLISLSIAFSLLVGATTNTSVIAYDPSGTWELDIELPDRTEEGTMTISKDKDGDFEVTLEDSNSDETKELEDVSFDEEEKTMTGEFETEGYSVKLEISFDGDSVEGTISAGGFDLSFTGER